MRQVIGIFMTTLALTGLLLGSAVAMNYTMIKGSWYVYPTYTRNTTSYILYNTSPSDSIPLGSVYVMRQGGISSGDYTVYDGFVQQGLKIPPLGNIGFALHDIPDLDPMGPSDPPGGFLVIFSWEGSGGSLKIQGTFSTYEASGGGEIVSSVGLEPL